MSYIVHEYRCIRGHQYDSMETRGEVREHVPCECGELGRKVISAPRLKVPLTSVVTTGRSVSERPPNVPDTRMLADGMDRREWEKRHEAPRRKDEDMERFVRKVRNQPDSRLHEL